MSRTEEPYFTEYLLRNIVIEDVFDCIHKYLIDGVCLPAVVRAIAAWAEGLRMLMEQEIEGVVGGCCGKG